MKRIFILIFVCFLAALMGCKQSGTRIVPGSDPASEAYDWNAARKAFSDELEDVLKIMMAGAADEYRSADMSWADKASPDAHAVMFPSTTPPISCSASVTYSGYSSPNFNSDGAEYLIFNARRMNNETLASIDWKIIIKISRGNSGYYVSGYSMENVA